MTIIKSHIAATLALAAITATSACTANDPKPTLSTTSPSTTTSPTMSVSSPPTSATASTSPERAAEDLAAKMVVRYFQDRDTGLFEPTKTTPGFFKDTTISSELIARQNTLAAAQGQKIHQVGSTQLVSTTRKKISLKNDPKASPPVIPTVEFEVCYDVRKVNIVDANGKSVVPASRKARGIMRVGVSNYEYPSPTAWRVAFTDTSQTKTC